MRHALLSAALLLGVAGPVWAQSNPNADQIVKSLSPISTGGENRGVRIATPTGVPSPVVHASAPATAQPSASLSDGVGRADTGGGRDVERIGEGADGPTLGWR